MNIAFVPTDYSDLRHCQALADWRNDPHLRKFWVPVREAEGTQKIFTAEDVSREFSSNSKERWSPAVDELGVLGDRIVGQFTLYLNPNHRRLKLETVAWPSLIIGEKSCRGSGMIRRFGERIFLRSRELGATHIEVGVFEFNTPMRSVLQKAGFEEFDRVERITHQEGQAWADIRYKKAL